MSCAFVDSPETGKTGIVLAGGEFPGGNTAQTYFYHIRNNSWTRMGNLKRQRAYAGELVVMKVKMGHGGVQNELENNPSIKYF